MGQQPETQKRKRPVHSGPVSEHVRHNIQRLRGQESRQSLADRLAELGHPSSAGSILKIEVGSRRVDVDDLVAFSVALGVNPSALLLPPVADGTPVQLTSTVTEPAFAAWEWVDGVYPLSSATVLQDAVRDGTEGDLDVDELNAAYGEFRRRARPQDDSEGPPAVRIAGELSGWVKSFVQHPLPTFRQLVHTRIVDLQRVVDEIEIEGS